MPRALTRTRYRTALLALLAAGLLPIADAGAQTAPATARTARPPAPSLLDSSAPAINESAGAAPQSGMVDESALRFYASQKQTARMNAEIARLKRLYPGWTVPSGLDSIQPSPPEEAPLWDLFTAGRLDELRAMIASTRASNPDWKTSDELSQKLRRAEFRNSIRKASALDRPDEIIARYREDPEAVDPADIETLWFVADALAAARHPDDAYKLYKLVLDTSTESQQRIATLQKAVSKLPLVDAERLVGLALQSPTGAADTAAITNDITRARIVAFLHDEPAQAVPQPDLVKFRDYVRASGDVNQMSLMGWYAYKRQMFREALDWFKAAISLGGDAMVAHGLAHTLRELGMDRDAEEVAYAWRNQFVGNAILMIDLLERKLTLPDPPLVEANRIERYVRVVLETSSGEGAQALAWYAYNSCQFDVALEWFRRASAWLPSEPTVYGYGLTLQRLRRPKDFLEVVNRYDGLFPTVVGLLFRDTLPEQPDRCAPTPPPPPVAQPTPPPTGRQDPRSAAAAAAAAAAAPPPVGPLTASTVKRTDFPLAVPAGNPLRFPGPEAPKDALRPGEVFFRDPAGAPPLIARRVPGAGAMPYERLGFGLQPSYSGSDAVSVLQQPPIGTIWRDEEAQRVRAPSARRAAETDRFSMPEPTGTAPGAAPSFQTQQGRVR